MVKVGDVIRINDMEGEPQYSGKEGTVIAIDCLGQIHGTWGGCAIDPKIDSYTIISKAVD